MKKKTVIILFLITFILSLLPLSTQEAFAEEEEEKEYFVSLVYSAHILPSGGRSYSYRITYQSEFYDREQEVISERFYSWSQSMQEAGYKAEIDDDASSFTATLSFDSAEEYLIASGYDGFSIDESTDVKEKKTFFFTDYEYSYPTVFADLDDTKKYIGRLYKDFVKNIGISDENACLYFEYGTPYSTKMITTNADTVTYDTDNGIYLHILMIDPQNADKEFVICQHSPNSTNWYLLALLGGITVFGAVFAVFMVKRKKERS